MRSKRTSPNNGSPAPATASRDPSVTQRGRGFRSRKPNRKPRRSGALTVHMHVGDTPRSLTTLNRGSGSTNWVGFCGKRHVRLKPSNVERGLVRLTLAGRPLRTLGVLTAAAHSVPPGHPASTSVVQCARITVRVAAMTPPIAQATGADFG